MIPEEGKAPREGLTRQGELDVLAERRARRAWLSNPALARRAEAAEATVNTLETHLADLRRRQAEAEHEREIAAAQLAERDRELRRVKQREHAEQQLRVEAEEAAMRLRRVHRVELDRLQRRAEEAHAAAEHAEEQRAALAARLAGVSESCVRLERGVAALQSAAVELRAALDRDQHAAQARIRELEGELERALARGGRDPDPTHPARSEPEDVLRREEMAGALASAVERLRARVAAVDEQSEIPRSKIDQQTTGAPAVERPVISTPPPAAAEPAPAAEIPTVIVVPRLFPASRRRALRLAPAVRRVAVRLVEWADHAQSRPR